MKHSMLFTVAALAAATATAETTNQVAEATTSKNQIVVSATRIETPIEQVGSSISVVTAEDITWQNAQDLQSAIKLVPGLQQTGNGGPGTPSSVFIRGAESDHTLVLINGIRVNSNTDGGFDFSSLPTDMIESIEVLRGPQSGLYGSDALGGVISITTKKGATTPLGGSASTAIGEKGYRTGTVGLHGGGKVLDFNSSVSFQGLENHDISKAAGGTEDDPYRRVSAYAGMGLNFASDGRANLTVLYTDDKNELDGYGGVDDPLENSQKKKFFTSLSAAKPITDIYTQKVSAGYNTQEYTGYNGGPVDYTTDSYDASLQADVTPVESDTLSVGYDFRRSEAENKGNFDKNNRDQHAVFANNKWSWKESLFLNLGGRYDDFSDVDGKATWKASASWFALENTRLHGSAGTGYRAPTMNDIYFTFGGPPRSYLKPEQSESYDIGLEQTVLDGMAVADITFFQTRTEDLIEWAYVGPNPWDYSPMNVDKADIEGFETSLTVKPADGLTTRVFYTYTDAKNAATGQRLARRALHTGGASINWQYSKAGSVNADYTYTGLRYEDSANSQKLNDFGLVGIGTRYAVTDSAALVANISNLLDKYYETAQGYGSVGRIASAGIEIKF